MARAPGALRTYAHFTRGNPRADVAGLAEYGPCPVSWRRMGVNALTIDGSTQNPEDVLRRIERGVGRLSSPAAVVLFLTGHLLKHADALAEAIAARFPRLPAILAGSEMVFTERGEVEGRDTFAGLLHSGTRAKVLTFEHAMGPFARAQGSSKNAGSHHEAAQVLAEVPALHLFSNFPTGHGSLPELPPSFRGLGWFGADTTTDAPLWTVSAEGEVGTAPAVRLEFPGLRAPHLMGASCCRVISDAMTVTAISGTTLLELDHTPALVALSQVTSQLAERSWIVLAIAGDREVAPETAREDPSLDARRLEAGALEVGALEVGALGVGALEHGRVPRAAAPTLFRPLRGIDPARGALIVREPLAVGTRVCIAVRDDHVARKSLEDALRREKYGLSGSSPRFGLFFEGLGRGRQLYGAPNVELSLIRHSFGEFPLLGSRSTFELQELDGHLIVQAMSGQLALFTSAS